MNLGDESSSYSEEALTTVLIPVYNRSEFLNDAIRSVFNQTISHWRLAIAVDTADPPAELMRVLEPWRSDKRLTVIFTPHVNQCHAMNNAVKSSITTRYTTQLDSDDLLTPFALSAVYDFIRSNPAVGYFYTSRALIDESTDYLKIGGKSIRPAEEFSPARLEGSFIAQHMITWKNAEFINAGGFDEELPFAEDYLLALNMMLYGTKFMAIDRICYLLRMHSAGSITSSLTRIARERFHLLARAKYLKLKNDLGISWNGEPSNVMCEWKR
jgi:glycosyltransferase involved in cell wall biosynthesis